MGRHQTRVSSFRRNDGPRWSDPYYQEWGVVVGDRIRRLRNARGWSLVELGRRISKPEGGHYSPGYFSRLERGWASAPLYVYLVIARELEVEPGTLLGPDEAQREVRPAEAVLLELLRAAKIRPGQAIARLSGLAGERSGR
jgi:transcriptional regulator with XRE-family HTH domain